MVKALEILEPSAPSARDASQSSCIEGASPVQSPSAHRGQENCHESSQQNNGLDMVKSGQIYAKPAKVKWVTLEPFWAMSPERDFKDSEHSLSCLCGKAGSGNQQIFTELLRLLTWAGVLQRAAPFYPPTASLPGPSPACPGTSWGTPIEICAQ